MIHRTTLGRTAICHDILSDPGPGPIKPPLPGPKGGIELRKVKNMDVIQADIYNALGVGGRNAKTRKELKRITGYRDRLIRETIEAMRRDRVILNQGRGNGYYLPDSGPQGLLDTIMWLEREDKRIESLKESTKAARRYIRNEKRRGLPGQINMFGTGGM